MTALCVPAVAQQDTPPAAIPTPAKPKAKPHKPSARSNDPAKPTVAAVGGAQPVLLGQYGDWGAYSASPGGKKVCFALGRPMTSQTTPPDKPRNPAFMFISSRPGDRISNEVSIIIGYAFKPSSEATAEIGPTSFALYTQQDGAWVKNGTEEQRMIEAMRAGQSAIVKGISARGTKSVDTFSLKGFAQAVDRSDQECK